VKPSLVLYYSYRVKKNVTTRRAISVTVSLEKSTLAILIFGIAPTKKNSNQMLPDSPRLIGDCGKEYPVVVNLTN
jgi:hypothetical protein